MTIQVIAFDIGGVLEYNPRLGVDEKWEQLLQLEAGAFKKQIHDLWRSGSIGTISLEEVHKGISEIMGMDEAQVNAYMEEVWKEYVGIPNTELIQYFQNLRSQYQTAIISNSFVGAREREMPLYHFDEMTDLVIYSHEVHCRKPDRRIYELTCERLQIQPSEMIFVDDVEANVTAAREFGIHAIQFKDNAQVIAEIQAYLQAAVS